MHGCPSYEHYERKGKTDNFVILLLLICCILICLISSVVARVNKGKVKINRKRLNNSSFHMYDVYIIYVVQRCSLRLFTINSFLFLFGFTTRGSVYNVRPSLLSEKNWFVTHVFSTRATYSQRKCASLKSVCISLLFSLGVHHQTLAYINK